MPIVLHDRIVKHIRNYAPNKLNDYQAELEGRELGQDHLFERDGYPQNEGSLWLCRDASPF